MSRYGEPTFISPEARAAADAKAARIAAIRPYFPDDVQATFLPDDEREKGDTTSEPEFQKAQQLRSQLISSLEQGCRITYFQYHFDGSRKVGSIQNEKDVDNRFLDLDALRASLWDPSAVIRNRYGRRVSNVQRTSYDVRGSFNPNSENYTARITVDGFVLVDDEDNPDLTGDMQHGATASLELIVSPPIYPEESSKRS